MAKIRVHELAKKLERTNREVMDALKGIGVDVKSHMSNVEDTQAEKIREKFKMTGKEQKVESPNNEKNLNKMEETAPAVLSRNDRITARKAREDRRAAAVEDL